MHSFCNCCRNVLLSPTQAEVASRDVKIRQLEERCELLETQVSPCEPYTTGKSTDLCSFISKVLAHLQYKCFTLIVQHMLATWILSSVEMGNLAAKSQERYSYAVTLGRTPPPSSHGSYKPIDEHPTALREPSSCGNKAGVPAANRTTSLVTSCWLTP